MPPWQVCSLEMKILLGSLGFKINLYSIQPRERVFGCHLIPIFTPQILNYIKISKPRIRFQMIKKKQIKRIL